MATTVAQTADRILSLYVSRSVFLFKSDLDSCFRFRFRFLYHSLSDVIRFSSDLYYKVDLGFLCPLDVLIGENRLVSCGERLID